MVVRHTTEQVSDYYERIGLNQSSLKVLLESGVQAYVSQVQELTGQDEHYYEEKKHFIVGSAIDCYLTHGEDVFLEKYHLSQLKKKPGESAMSVIKLAYDKACRDFPLGPDNSLQIYRRHVYEAANEEGYYMNRKNKDGDYMADTRISELLKQNGQAYWEDLISSEGKQVLSDDEQTVINSVVLSLTTHKHTAHLFKDGENLDIVFQFPLYFTVDDVDSKGMIDVIIIDHNRQRIIPIDIKTTMKPVLLFNKVISHRRYDIQASFYSHGLQKCLGQLGALLAKSINNYTISNFAFVVASTAVTSCPMVFVLEDSIMQRGEWGDEEEGVQGWRQGVKKYKDWVTSDFSIEVKYMETNGVIFLSDKNINSVI